MSDSNRTSLYGALETSWGETPDQTKTLREIPTTGHDIKGAKEVVNSDRIRSDLQMDASGVVGESAGGTANIEFTLKNFDLYLQSAINAASIVDVDLNGEACTIDESAGTIVADSGTPFTAAMQLAKYVRVAGAANSGNNGVKRVISMTADTITVPAADLTDDEAGVSLDLNARYIRNGTSLISFLIEKVYADVNKRMHYRGMSVSQFQITFPSKDKVTGTITLAGKSEVLGFNSVESASAGDGSPSDDYGTQILNTSSHVGALLEGGSPVSDSLRSFTLNIEAGKRERPYVGSTDSLQHGLNGMKISGSAEFYFDSFTMYTKFKNHTDSSLQIPFTDQAGNFFAITIPALKYDEGSNPVNGQDSDIFLSANWSGFKHATDGYTIQLDMIPV